MRWDCSGSPPSWVSLKTYFNFKGLPFYSELHLGVWRPHPVSLAQIPCKGNTFQPCLLFQWNNILVHAELIATDDAKNQEQLAMRPSQSLTMCPFVSWHQSVCQHHAPYYTDFLTRRHFNSFSWGSTSLTIKPNQQFTILWHITVASDAKMLKVIDLLRRQLLTPLAKSKVVKNWSLKCIHLFLVIPTRNMDTALTPVKQRCASLDQRYERQKSVSAS